MTAGQLKEEVLRAEGYAKGFLDGFVSMANRISSDLAKDKKIDTNILDNEEMLKNSIQKQGT